MSLMKPVPRGQSRQAGTMGIVASLAGKKKEKNRHISQNVRSGKPGGINLKAVAAVLEENGLDPTVELIKILRPVNDEGEPVPSRLAPDIQARILNELLQYVQPKLKSIEIKGRIGIAGFNPTDEQARAMAEEFLRGEAVAATNEDEDTTP